MGISSPKNLEKKESSRLCVSISHWTNKKHLNYQNAPSPLSRAPLWSSRLQAPVHSSQPLEALDSPLGNAAWRAPLDVLKGFGTKALPDGCKDGRMRYEHCSFGFFCAFALNVQNIPSETFLLARVRVTKLCGLGRWQYDPGFSVRTHSACKTWHGFAKVWIIQSPFTAIPLVKTLGVNSGNNASYNF